ncbi:MAG TPA: immunoglobulin domain-containing protein, partial [Verrucomicrobiae bacterium]
MAFNDHAPGTIGLTTHPNATTWNIFGNAPGASGFLKDITSGLDLPVQVAITRSGTVNPAPNGNNPNPGTPLYNVFNGYVDFQGAGNPDAVAQVTGSSTVTYTFTGLNPTRTYGFKGSAVRGGSGGSYPQRWSLFQIDGAVSFASAHTAGCLTSGLAANQVAINTGVNLEGDMADWENIVPDNSGSFSVTTTQYTGPIPAGGTANGPYCYALSGFRLEEMAADTPVSITRSPTNTVVAELAPASLSVVMDGSPRPAVQWFRNNTVLSGATNRTYTILSASLTSNGDLFKAVGQNLVSNVTYYATSSVARLTVIADTNPPVLMGAQAIGLDQVQVFFSERITPTSATNTSNYSITSSGINLPILGAVLDASQTNVILSVSSMAESSVCTLRVSNLA